MAGGGRILFSGAAVVALAAFGAAFAFGAAATFFGLPSGSGGRKVAPVLGFCPAFGADVRFVDICCCSCCSLSRFACAILSLSTFSHNSISLKPAQYSGLQLRRNLAALDSLVFVLATLSFDSNLCDG